MVGGEGLTGVLLAIYVVSVGGGQPIGGLVPWLEETPGLAWLAHGLTHEWISRILALAAIGCIALLLGKFAKRRFGAVS